MLGIEFSNKITDVNDNHSENTETRLTYNHEIVSTKEEECKTSINEDTMVSTNDRLLESSKCTSDQILSMTKLRDIENFMDTLLDSKLEESGLDDSSQNISHDAELSTAKPLTDVQLMGELCKLNEKLLSTSEHKSSNDSNANKSEKIEKAKKKPSAESSTPFNSCIGNFTWLCIIIIMFIWLNANSSIP